MENTLNHAQSSPLDKHWNCIAFDGFNYHCQHINATDAVAHRDKLLAAGEISIKIQETSP